jgi:ubiquinone/menaquinone biosynthesis C-methylase UbiE
VTHAYVHGYADEEQARLISQAEHWRDEVILSGTALRPGTRLLEVGCGVGAVLGILGDAFPGVVLCGVDVEERQLEAARAHLARLGLQADLRRADAVDLPYRDASFDHVWMMWFLEHIADPVAALREARRVLVPSGRLTAIEVDYTSVRASPSSDAVEALFAAVARTMAANGHSDAGARLENWLIDAEFESVDAGKRRLAYSGADLARQVPYVADVVESILPTLDGTSEPTPAQLQTGLAHLRALSRTPGSALGWHLYKATAVHGAPTRRIQGRDNRTWPAHTQEPPRAAGQ